VAVLQERFLEGSESRNEVVSRRLCTTKIPKHLESGAAAPRVWEMAAGGRTELNSSAAKLYTLYRRVRWRRCRRSLCEVLEGRVVCRCLRRPSRKSRNTSGGLADECYGTDAVLVDSVEVVVIGCDYLSADSLCKRYTEAVS